MPPRTTEACTQRRLHHTTLISTTATSTSPTHAHVQQLPIRRSPIPLVPYRTPAVSPDAPAKPTANSCTTSNRMTGAAHAAPAPPAHLKGRRCYAARATPCDGRTMPARAPLLMVVVMVVVVGRVMVMMVRRVVVVVRKSVMVTEMRTRSAPHTATH